MYNYQWRDVICKEETQCFESIKYRKTNPTWEEGFPKRVTLEQSSEGQPELYLGQAFLRLGPLKILEMGFL